MAITFCFLSRTTRLALLIFPSVICAPDDSTVLIFKSSSAHLGRGAVMTIPPKAHISTDSAFLPLHAPALLNAFALFRNSFSPLRLYFRFNVPPPDLFFSFSLRHGRSGQIRRRPRLSRLACRLNCPLSAAAIGFSFERVFILVWQLPHVTREGKGREKKCLPLSTSCSPPPHGTLDKWPRSPWRRITWSLSPTAINQSRLLRGRHVCERFPPAADGNAAHTPPGKTAR